jgi:hypothetical protein
LRQSPPLERHTCLVARYYGILKKQRSAGRGSAGRGLQAILANSKSFASSSAWIAISGVNGRKLPEKLVQRVTALKVIDRILEGNARAAKTRHSTQYFRVDHNYGLAHGVNPLWAGAG